MNREALITELKARGFDYLPASRCANYLNDAYLVDICEQEDWPFLQALETGIAPLSILDLRSVRWVIDATNEVKLAPLDPREITDNYGANIAEAGTPSFWYMQSAETLATFPTSTTITLQVAYWRAPSLLEGASDEPVLPTRFHSLVIDGAVARAYEDSDDYELAQNARENFEARLQRMRESLLGQNRDLPDEFISMIDPGEAA